MSKKKKQKINYSEFESIKNFKKNIDKILKLIEQINFNIGLTKRFSEILLKEGEGHKKEKAILKKMNIKDSDVKSIYELGFTSLYSNFETFMYDFLKELYSKFPQNIDSNKLFKVSEIYNLKSKKELRDYIQDTLAIENSFTLETWCKHLKNNFKINCFENNKHRDGILIFNEIRNLLIHSDGKINYKFSKNMKKYFKINIPVNIRFNLIRDKGEKYLKKLHTSLNKIIETIKTSN